MSTTQSIASNCNNIVLGNSSISVTLGTTNYTNLKPSLRLAFDAFFKLRNFSRFYLQALVNQFFQIHYLCGNGVRFSSSMSSVIVKSVMNEETRFEDNIIYLDYYLENPIEFLHEIIHAIIDSVDSDYDQHNLSRNEPCHLLDLYANEAPGFMLDMVNRLEMHFTSAQLGTTQIGQLYLPEIATVYPSLVGFCTSFSLNAEEEEEDDDRGNKKKADSNKKPKLSEEDFLKLKFGDEYDILSSIKGFPKKLDKKNYIKRNLERYFERKNEEKK